MLYKISYGGYEVLRRGHHAGATAHNFPVEDWTGHPAYTCQMLQIFKQGEALPVNQQIAKAHRDLALLFREFADQLDTASAAYAPTG